MNYRLEQWLPFLRWGQLLNRRILAQDLMAGLTGAIIVLPQGVAYALIAGLPAEYGIYTAIVTAIVAALFGSSLHLVSGPTAAISIVIMSIVNATPLPSQDYLSTVLCLTLMAGCIQLGLGMMRLGSLVNFISHTVVIGFTAGAAIIIAASQLKHLLGVQVESGLSFMAGLSAVYAQLSELNPTSLLIGLVTLATALAVRQLNRRWPHLLVGMAVGSLVCFGLDGAAKGVPLVGALSGSLPNLNPPDLSFSNAQVLASGAFAVALLGLIEAASIARAIAVRSGQQINGNQEFIGQGLSNIIGSLFSCYAGSGSFTRSGANYDAGAKTPLATVFAACILALILVLVPGITAYLPLPAMAGSILLIAWNLIDWHHIRQILGSNRNEACILSVTFLSTLLLDLEFAIYIGVILSLVLYLRRTSKPTLMEVAPIQQSPERRIRNAQRYRLHQCPQVKLLRLDGSLFFGAIEHVQQQLRSFSNKPGSRILLICKGINFIDITGADMLAQEARRIERHGGQLLFSSLKGTVIDELDANGYLDKLEKRRIYETPKAALAVLTTGIDQDICQGCDKRVFAECSSPALIAKSAP